jgi:hypothetical protein
MLGDQEAVFEMASINVKGSKAPHPKSPVMKADTVLFFPKDASKESKRAKLVSKRSVKFVKEAPQKTTRTRWEKIQSWLFDHRLELFWLALFYLVLGGIAGERIYSNIFFQKKN